MGFYSVENDKIRYGFGITLLKKQKQVAAGVFFPLKMLMRLYFIKTAKISYGWGLNLYKMLK